MSDVVDNAVIRRIHSIRIRGFRGFCGEELKFIDTDADIVLITGGNGFGKSSLLQALTLLLTGHLELPAEQLFSLIHKDNDHENGESGSPSKYQSMSIQARCALGTPTEPPKGCLGLEWNQPDAQRMFTSNFSSAWPRHPFMSADEHEHQKEEVDELGRRILARLTSFYVENNDELFADITRGSILRDVFYPVPAPVKEMVSFLKESSEQLHGRRIALRRFLRDPEKLHQSIIEEMVHYKTELDSIIEAMSKLETVTEKKLKPSLFGPFALFRELSAHSDRGSTWVLSEIGHLSYKNDRMLLSRELDRLNSYIDSEIGLLQNVALLDKEAEHLHEELADLSNQLRNIEQNFPSLDADIQCFEPMLEPAGLIGLPKLFESIAKQRDHWINSILRLPEPDLEKFGAVLAELRLVMPNNAFARFGELEAWLEPRRLALAERAELLNRKSIVERKIKEHRVSDDIEAFKRLKKAVNDENAELSRIYQSVLYTKLLIESQPTVIKMLDTFERLQTDIDGAVEALKEATGANEDILQHTLELATKVLSRFALVEGILDLKPDSDGENFRRILTESGLELAQLSMGQKSQVAVSLAVAQSELLRRANNVDLPFNLLLLDDVSTAYDLSNITREAILWRQLAYHSKPDQRWQLFISSHHEDLSNHLLDLLVPPEGCRLRVLQFKGWSQESGPEIESFEVEPSRAIEGQARLGIIGESLKEALCQA